MIYNHQWYYSILSIWSIDSQNNNWYAVGSFHSYELCKSCLTAYISDIFLYLSHFIVLFLHFHNALNPPVCFKLPITFSNTNPITIYIFFFHSLFLFLVNRCLFNRLCDILTKFSHHLKILWLMLWIMKNF